MRVKLPIDKTNRVEIYFSGPSLAIKNLMELDSLLVSSRTPAVISNPEYLNDINVMKLQRGSKYDVIAAIDFEGKTFGGNKVHQIQNLIEADGFDIGLSANKNVTELMNEIKVINAFLSRANKTFKMRWVINSKYGPAHIENCFAAIKNSKTRYDLISILTDNTDAITAHNIAKKCRKFIGIPQCKMKINGNPDDDKLITNAKNIVYHIKAEDLV